METENLERVADDLFAGAGGWDVAAVWLRLHSRGVENMPAARATRDAAGLTTIHDDVWTFKPDGLAEGLIASPPCQTFSQAGKGAGRKALDAVLTVIKEGGYNSIESLRAAGERFGDERTALVLTPLHFATQYSNYRWLAWEQVPTVLPVWEACAEVLRAEGWSVWTGLLQAEQYGVPQTRKRAFLIASRDREVTPPTPTHSKFYPRNPTKQDEGVLRWVSMAEALDWGLSERPSPTVTGGGTETGGAEPIAHLTRYTERPDWFQATNDRPHVAKRSPEQPAPTLAFGHERPRWVFAGAGKTSIDTAGQRRREPEEPAHTITGKGTAAWVAEGLPDWAFNRPSTTIVGSFKPEVVAAPGYRTTVSRQNAPDSVRVSVQEAGILQSFPANYPWQGAKGKQFLQAGNAVPPLLAMAVLKTLL